MKYKQQMKCQSLKNYTGFQESLHAAFLYSTRISSINLHVTPVSIHFTSWLVPDTMPLVGFSVV